VKLKKLKFIDSKRFRRGVDMDVKNQLLTVALKKGQTADYPAMRAKISEAGYDPMEWFALENGKLKTTPFAKHKK
jgi:hypothetical protein